MIWLWGVFLLAIMIWSVDGRGFSSSPFPLAIQLGGFLGSFAFILVPVFAALPYMRAIRFGVLAAGELQHVESAKSPAVGEAVLATDSVTLRKRFTSGLPWLREAHVGDSVEVVVDSRRPRVMLILAHNLRQV